jgi:hypothetical protein
MKKLILSIAAFGLLYITNVSAQTGQERGQQRGQQEQPQVQTQPQEGQEWQRSEDNTWRGRDNVWYRMEGGTIMKSEDGQTWERSEDNRFQSSDGVWYRYEEGQLRRSQDGQQWEGAEDWSDQDGRSFRFDEQGRLNTRGGTGTDDARGERRPEHRDGVTGEAGEREGMERDRRMQDGAPQ